MPKIRKKPYKIYNEDCFETFKRIEPGSVDLVLVDPPYGTTQCRWDSIIDIERMWESVLEVAKPNAALVFCATQPFASVLICSRLKLFKYEWIWDKHKHATGFLDSKKKPLRNHEQVLVFYQKQPTYNPQFTKGSMYSTQRNGSRSSLFNSQSHSVGVSEGRRFPKSVQRFAKSSNGLHPTQKPILLMEYLIKTYTNPGDLVLDFAMGSGTTGVACMRTGRRFIGCDSDTHFGYFDIAKLRIENQLEKINGAGTKS